MINKLLPALFRRLRLRQDLTRKQFAVKSGLSYGTLRNYEKGRTRPELQSEEKLLAAAACSDLEIAELLCELMSEELEVRVGIVDGEAGYRPGSSLIRAEEFRRRFGDELDDSQLRTLNNKIHTAQLMRMVYERHNADLDEYIADCRARAARRRQESSQGATGPTGVVGTDFHTAGTGRRTGNR